MIKISLILDWDSNPVLCSCVNHPNNRRDLQVSFGAFCRRFRRPRRRRSVAAPLRRASERRRRKTFQLDGRVRSRRRGQRQRAWVRFSALFVSIKNFLALWVITRYFNLWSQFLAAKPKPGSFAGAYQPSRWAVNLFQGIQAMGNSELCTSLCTNDHWKVVP